MPQVVTIRSLPQAFEIIKSMEHDGYEWGEDYRAAGRAALVDVLEGRLHEAIDRHLEGTAARGEADRRNGSYRRRLLTELGHIELHIPRTRRFIPTQVIHAYARRGIIGSEWRGGDAVGADAEFGDR